MRRLLAVMLGFGFLSGLPLPLCTFTLHQWLVTAGASPQMVGLTSILALPYVLKFLWAPAFDAAPGGSSLGRRRGWLMLVQPALGLAIVLQGLSDPAHAIWLTAAATLLVAFLSASQDIVIDAWRIDTFEPRSQGAALAAYVWGYRGAMAVASPGVIWASGWAGWHWPIAALGIVLAAGASLSWAAPEPASSRVGAQPGFAAAIWRPLQEFLTRPRAGSLLAFVILFRLGKVCADTMAAPFYRALGFGSAAVAGANFLPSLGGTLAGAAIGGVLVTRLGVRRAVLAAGVAQCAALGLYLALYTAPVPAMLYAKVGGEYLAGAAADTAFLAFISSLCARQFSASQYAMLSALASLVFHTVATGAGFAAVSLGWRNFFVVCIVAGLPALLILQQLRKSWGQVRQSSVQRSAT